LEIIKFLNYLLTDATNYLRKRICTAMYGLRVSQIVCDFCWVIYLGL